MSSISSYSNQMPTITIDFAGNDRYRVSDPQDENGDGKALTGDGGRIVNESALNQILATRGLKAVNGTFQSVDGFQLTSSNTSAVTSFGSDPVLPNVSGPSTLPQTLQGRVKFMERTQGIDDAALMWMALSTLATTAMRDIKDASDLKRALQQGKIAAKNNEISATQAKITAEKEAATGAFGWAVVSTVVSALSSLSGKSILQNTSQALGSTVSKFGDMHGKNSGHQAEADYQAIRAQVYQREQETVEMSLEDAKSNYDEAKELFKNALKAISDHVDREVQVTQAITRG